MSTSRRLSNPGMIVAFICAVFGMISFLSACFTMKSDAKLAMALIRLLLGGIYFIGALINMFKGYPHGNLNLIFAVCFGLFAGSNMILSLVESTAGIHVDALIYGIVQVFAGCYLACLIPAMRDISAYRVVSYLFSALGLLLQGGSVLLNTPILNVLGGWSFLGFSICSIYTGLSAIINELPTGPSMGQFLYSLHKH